MLKSWYYQTNNQQCMSMRWYCQTKTQKCMSMRWYRLNWIQEVSSVLPYVSSEFFNALQYALHKCDPQNWQDAVNMTMPCNFIIWTVTFYIKMPHSSLNVTSPAIKDHVSQIDRKKTKPNLQVVWQFCAASIARVHCHKHSARTLQWDFHTFKEKAVHLHMTAKNSKSAHSHMCTFEQGLDHSIHAYTFSQAYGHLCFSYEWRRSVFFI